MTCVQTVNPAEIIADHVPPEFARLVYRLAGGTASFVGLEPATVSSQPLCLTLSPALGMAALAHPPGLKGHTEALECLAVEMLARGLSVRDIEDAFKDETGQLLLLRTAVSEIGQ